MGLVDLRRMLLFSAIMRLILVTYGEWQDSHMEVRYTDVDYLVFSDAAELVAAGRSPFERLTYRYSPLLAFLLIPNSLLHKAWGKLLFSVADLLVGFFVDSILKLCSVPEKMRLYSVATWLFNPFTFTIGTRGNCEPIVCAVVLGIILSIMKGKVLQAAFWYGLIVHFRIYPIVYSLPFVLALSKWSVAPSGKPALKQWSPLKEIKRDLSTTRTSKSSLSWNSLWMSLTSIVTWETAVFGLISGAVFLALTAVFFFLYGWDFMNEALLYHLTRTDPRHNFSIYFYHIYLHHQQEFSVWQKLVSFLPQFMVQLTLIFSFAGDLIFCLFAQTVAFVAFNKVMTAQYFVWFFCLLPLILPWSRMKLKWEGSMCTSFWMIAQLHWLMWAYLLEFKGRSVFIQVWLASIIFLVANTTVLVMLIRNHNFSPLFVPSARTKLSSSKKSD